jgi:hypothetical protein
MWPAATLAVLAWAAVSAQAGTLQHDLRLTGGGTAVAVTSPTQVVTGIELWEVILGAAEPHDDEGLSKFYCSIHSSSGGLVTGDLSATWAKVYWPEYGVWAPTLLSMSMMSKLGAWTDLDGDGDVDIGSNDPHESANWILGRLPDILSPLPGDQHHTVDLVFTGTGWGDQPHGVTEVYAVPRFRPEDRPPDRGIDDIWFEEGEPLEFGDVAGGQRIILYRPAEADAGGGYVAAPGGGVPLDGSDSVGTIDEWLWDLDGDGTTDVTGETVAVSFADLVKVYGLAPGVHDVTLTTYSTYTQDSATVPLTVLPEPGTAALLIAGGVAAVVARRRAAPAARA